MPTFLKLLESFNRKERFFLVGQALGNPKFQLSDGFRSMLGGQDAFGIVPPKDALVFMDYHLDWLHASLFLSLPENDAAGVHPNSRQIATGTQEDILHENGEIIAKHPEYIRRHNSGQIILGNNCEIDSNVKIEGPVIIGDNCKILSKATIGPNVSIGNNSIISVSLIENSIIMDNCKINSTTEIKNSIIANNSEIEDVTGSAKVFLLGEGSKISL